MSSRRTTSCPEAVALLTALLVAGGPGCHPAAPDLSHDPIARLMNVDPSQLKPEDVVNHECVVELTAPSTPVLFRGPIPVVVSVTNRGARPLTVNLEYPLYTSLRFDSPSAKRKLVVPPENYFVQQATIPPGGRASRTYYLNRYLAFDAPGIARVTWRLGVSIAMPDGRPWEQLVGRGELTYTLVETGDDALKEELSNYAVGMRSSDEKVKEEAAEALGFLDTPLALEYQARMLTVWNLEPRGIQALGRSSSPAAHAVIVKMLASDRPLLVFAAQEELDRLGPAMPREKVRQLLAASDPKVRRAALEVLIKHPDATDRAAVSPLLEDPDADLRGKAKAYVESLPR
jgi:hypothetical protein